MLLKPQTFMNNSGHSVGEAMRFHKITPANTIVFYDEIDLAPGRFRMKTGGGAAGHNGIRSIIAQASPDVRRAPHGRRPSRRQGTRSTPTCCPTSPRPTSPGSPP